MSTALEEAKSQRGDSLSKTVFVSSSVNGRILFV